MRKLFCNAGLTIALAFALAASPALAQVPFYQGKQLKVLVGFPPGGGTDLYGRVIADGLVRHVEGKPGVVVQHMRISSWPVPISTVVPSRGTLLA
jgi:tripartite-type tricarboxylate transporter receptor subunit TctC